MIRYHRLVVTAAQVGKAAGAKIIATTSYSESDLAKLADEVVIKGRTM